MGFREALALWIWPCYLPLDCDKTCLCFTKSLRSHNETLSTISDLSSRHETYANVLHLHVVTVTHHCEFSKNNQINRVDVHEYKLRLRIIENIEAFLGLIPRLVTSSTFNHVWLISPSRFASLAQTPCQTLSLKFGVAIRGALEVSNSVTRKVRYLCPFQRMQWCNPCGIVILSCFSVRLAPERMFMSPNWSIGWPRPCLKGQVPTHWLSCGNDLLKWKRQSRYCQFINLIIGLKRLTRHDAPQILDNC